MVNIVPISAAGANMPPFLYNVDEEVGVIAKCPNRPDDIKLVRALIRANQLVWAASPICQGITRPVPMGDRMDDCLAFWIVWQLGLNRSARVDYAISPYPKNLGYLDPQYWIARENSLLWQTSKLAFYEVGIVMGLEAIMAQKGLMPRRGGR